MAVQLRRMTNGDRTEVIGLRVTSEQAAYVEPLNEVLAIPNRDHYVLESFGCIIGFFQIDASSGVQCVPEHLELHEFSIDQAQQGKGHGRTFVKALPNFLQCEYPGWRGVCLTVNCNNASAKRLYELGGFVDTGRLKLEGRSGPQHIMCLELT